VVVGLVEVLVEGPSSNEIGPRALAELDTLV
jgi:hypothetical protein